MGPRNYLRVRGEYNYGPDRLFLNKELPPRARRIRDQLYLAATNRGTTSACAENTPLIVQCGLPRRNYLRVRGEYADIMERSIRALELPPRARRIRGDDAGVDHFPGTTSACAENTPIKIRRCG